MKVQGKGIAAVIVAVLVLAACDTGAGAEFVTYTGESGGVRYTLTVTENTARYAAQIGDRYELAVGSRRSAGTVSDVNGGMLTLRPENAPETTFTASVSGGRLTALNGRITWDDGSTASAPGRMTGTTYNPPYSPPSTPPQSDVWSVVYRANGGEGTMPDSTAEVGEAITLSENTFTRSGCTFAGWAESAAGAQLYGDEEKGVPCPDAGTTLDLYALWTVESGQEAAVVEAATSEDTLILTGVEWSGRLPGEVESALGKGVTTLNLSGVSGLEEWDKDTLNSGKGNIISLTLPDTVTTLKHESNGAFGGYDSLESVSGAGVTNVGEAAFYQCTALETVSLPAAKGIGDSAFDGCTKLTEVSLPAAKTIGESAFIQCSQLTTVSLPAAKTIGGGAFVGTGLKTVSLPVVETIGDYAFQDTPLKTVSLPAAKDIDEGAFDGCTNLTEVNLPTATDIGDYAFYGCTVLTTVSLPEAKTIGGGAFGGCNKLTSLTLPATPPDLGSNVFQNDNPTEGTVEIHIGTGNVSDYTDKWEVSDYTAAKGNEDIYGENHKAINIVN
jgi:hypothetical protein